ncbi:MAG: hypothetical protein JWN52_1496 [Actinomycetia bacterium]|nr:hypothetical protein [Actinomycetes bacterium]
MPPQQANSDDPHGPLDPLHGVPLTGPTGLRLLVGANNPVVLDVDQGTRRPLTGLPEGADRDAVPYAVGADAVILSSCRDCAGVDEVYAVRHGHTVSTRIGKASFVTVTADRRGVWLVGKDRAQHCTLAQIDLDGHDRAPTRPLDCRVGPRTDTPLGLIVSRVGAYDGAPSTDEILSPRDGAVLFTASRIYAVAGHRVLSQGAHGFVFTDVQTGARRDVTWPTSVGEPSDGLADPTGRYLAISFDHPAWPGPRQRMDVWLLELATLRWLHMPSMPVPAALKFTGMNWTPDGRLILLGEFDGLGGALAVWRPGEGQPAVRKLVLPERGGDAFLVW